MNNDKLQKDYPDNGYTLDECKRLGRTHAAYGWADNPWGHFTAEQVEAYYRGFDGYIAEHRNSEDQSSPRPFRASSDAGPALSFPTEDEARNEARYLAKSYPHNPCAVWHSGTRLAVYLSDDGRTAREIDETNPRHPAWVPTKK